MSDAITKTILIVDDEPTIHKALQRTLRREPYEILNAYDAAEAMAILDGTAEVDAIICDHYMPETYGLELLLQLRKTHPDLVKILLTAQADLTLVMNAVNEGHIDRFFTKPWDANQLRLHLRGLLGDGAGAEDGPDDEDGFRARMLPPRDEHTGAFIIEAMGEAPPTF